MVSMSLASIRCMGAPRSLCVMPLFFTLHLWDIFLPPSLVLHMAYSTSPLLRISTNYMTLPSPLSSRPGLWSVILPILERQYDIAAIACRSEACL